jgi:hypothetical protein
MINAAPRQHVIGLHDPIGQRVDDPDDPDDDEIRRES